MEKILEIILDSFVDADGKNKVVMEVKDLKEIITVLKTQKDYITDLENDYWQMKNELSERRSTKETTK